jgi:hypothetical protein
MLLALNCRANFFVTILTACGRCAQGRQYIGIAYCIGRWQSGALHQPSLGPTQHVDGVTQVVQHEPTNRELVLELPEDAAP